MSVVAERSGRAGRLACWSSTVDLLAAVDERQLTVYRLNWQRLWSRSCDADVRVCKQRVWLALALTVSTLLASCRRRRCAGGLTTKSSPWALQVRRWTRDTRGSPNAAFPTTLQRS